MGYDIPDIDDPLEEQAREIIATFKDSTHPMIRAILTNLHRSLQCRTP